MLNKAAQVGQLKEGMWGLTETHLTQLGCERFRKQLRHQVPNAKFVPGFPAPRLSTSMNSIGGKAV